MLGASTTADGSFLVYTFDDASRSMIDVRHGHLVDEDVIVGPSTVAPNGNTMTNIIPTVYIDGTPLDQANEDAASGNDRYTIDYRNCTVTFAVARDPADVVTVDCRRVGAGPQASKWTFQPDPGMRQFVQDAEVDLTEDIDMDPTQPIVLATWGSHPIITGGAKVIIRSKKFKRFHDFRAPARKFFGPIPSGFGISGGVDSPGWTFQWDYLNGDMLYDTANFVHDNYYPAEVSERSVTLHKFELWSTNDREIPGNLLTILFVSSVEHENI